MNNFISAFIYMCLSLHLLFRSSQFLNGIAWRSGVEFYRNRARNVENTDKILITLVVEV
jgi:hypothetical protein